MEQQYDLIAIGCGPAGESAAVLAATFGRRVVVIERDRPGGAVTTTGGAPTKTLREAAVYLTGFRQRDIYGVALAAPPHIVLPTIAARTRQVCEFLQTAVAQNLARNHVEYLQGSARLVSNHSVAVTLADGAIQLLSADVILLATGSRPLRPAAIAFDDPSVCDSDTIFKLDQPPSDLLIVGGGAVGVEFATIFAALGARVTLCELGDRLLPTMDTELSHLMQAAFERMGVVTLLGVGIEGAARVGGVLQAQLTNDIILTPDTLLFAAGRRANTEGLGLEECGAALGRSGRIVVDGDYRTTVEGVYAAGDVLGPTLASVAMEQGRRAVINAFALPFRETVDSLSVSAVYGLPEVAGVGLTETQCQEQGIAYAVGRCDLAATARGAIAGHGGLLKLLFRRDDRRLLGVHAIGDLASELVGMGQAVISSGGAIDVFAALTLNTPTYTYAYKYATFDGLLRLADTLGGPQALTALAESAL